MIAGKAARVWAIPYGNFTLPEVKAAEDSPQAVEPI
jgi:hypothetical protein